MARKFKSHVFKLNPHKPADKGFGTRADDDLTGDDGPQKFHGFRGDDTIFAGGGNDKVFGDAGDDTIEAGAGDDFVHAGRGDDTVYAFSWAGEPEIAQDPNAQKVEPAEPLADDDTFVLGAGADTLVFRWLIDAKDAILDKHRDASGDVDYRQVAGENGNAHDHWVEGMGADTVIGFDPAQDTLVFEGHTVTLDRIDTVDADGDGSQDDSVAYFYSEQGGAGAHQGDDLGSVTFMDYLISAAEIQVDAGVFYGVEDPWTATG